MWYINQQQQKKPTNVLSSFTNLLHPPTKCVSMLPILVTGDILTIDPVSKDRNMELILVLLLPL